MNPRNLLVGSSRGGRELAEAVDTVRSMEKELKYMSARYLGILSGERDVGKLKIVQKGTSITLASGAVT
jgi:hypothetical protein